MADKRDRNRQDLPMLRWLMASLGTIPVALALGVALALTLPSRSSLGLAIGS